MSLRIFCISITILATLDALPIPSTRDYPDASRGSSSLFAPRHPYYSSALRVQLGIPHAQSTLLKNRIRHPASKLAQMLSERQQHPITGEKIPVASSGAHWYPGFEYGYVQVPEQIHNVARPHVSRKFFLEAKRRMKEAMANTKHLRDKVHHFGWGAGIPYYTTNEAHVIVKKPGTLNVPIFVPKPNTASATISQVDSEENLLVPEEKPQTYEAVPVKQDEPETQSASHVNDEELILEHEGYDDGENGDESENEAKYVSQGEHKDLGIEKGDDGNSSERVHASSEKVHAIRVGDDGDKADDDGILRSTTMRVSPIDISDVPETTDIRLATTVLPEKTVTLTPDSSSQYVRLTTATEEFGATGRPSIWSETGPIKFIIPVMLDEPASPLVQTEIEDSIETTVSLADIVSEGSDLLKGVPEMHEATNAEELDTETGGRQKSEEAVMGLKESEVSEVQNLEETSDPLDTVTERVVQGGSDYTGLKTSETAVGIQSVLEPTDSVMVAMDSGTRFVAEITHLPDEATSTMLYEVRGTSERTDSPVLVTDPGTKEALKATESTNVGRESDDRSVLRPTDSPVEMTRPEVRDGLETTDSPKMVTGTGEVLMTGATEPEVQTELPIAVTYAEVRGGIPTSDSQSVEMESESSGVSEPTDTTTELTGHEVRQVFGSSDLLLIANTAEVTEPQVRGVSETTDSAIVLTRFEVRPEVNPTESTTGLSQHEVRGVAGTTEPTLMVAELQVRDVIVTTDLPIAVTEAEVRGVPQTTDSSITLLEPTARDGLEVTDLPIVSQTTDSQVVFTEHEVRDVGETTVLTELEVRDNFGMTDTTVVEMNPETRVTAQPTEVSIADVESGVRKLFETASSQVQVTEPGVVEITDLPITQAQYDTRDIFDKTDSPIEQTAVLGTTDSPNMLRGSNTQDTVNTIVSDESGIGDVLDTTDLPHGVTIAEIRSGFQTTEASIMIREPEDRGSFVMTDSEVRSGAETTESPVVAGESDVRTVIDGTDLTNRLTESSDAVEATESSGMLTQLEVRGVVEITHTPIAITEAEVRNDDSPEAATGTGERIVALTTTPTEAAVRTAAEITDSSIDSTEQEVRNVFQTTDSWMVDPVLEVRGSFGTTDLQDLARTTESPIASADHEVRNGLGTTDSPNTDMEFEIRSALGPTESSIAVTDVEDRSLLKTSQLPIVATESEVRGVAEITDSLIETIEPDIRIGIQTTTDLPVAVLETGVRNAFPSVESTILVTEPDVRHVAVTTDSPVKEMVQEVRGSFETMVPPIVATEPEAHDILGMTDSPNVLIHSNTQRGVQTTDMPITSADSELLRLLGTTDLPNLETTPALRSVFEVSNSLSTATEPEVTSVFQTIVAVDSDVRGEDETTDLSMAYEVRELLATTKSTIEEARAEVHATDLPTRTTEPETRHSTEITKPAIEMGESEVRDAVRIHDLPIAVTDLEVLRVHPTTVLTDPDVRGASTESPNVVTEDVVVDAAEANNSPTESATLELRGLFQTTYLPQLRDVTDTTDLLVEHEYWKASETSDSPIMVTKAEVRKISGMVYSTIDVIPSAGGDEAETTESAFSVTRPEIGGFTEPNDSPVGITDSEFRDVVVTTESPIVVTEPEVRRIIDGSDSQIAVTGVQHREVIDPEEDSLVSAMEPELRFAIQTTDSPILVTESLPRNIAETLDSVPSVSGPIDLAIVEAEPEIRVEADAADSAIMMAQPEGRDPPRTTHSSILWPESGVDNAFETITRADSSVFQTTESPIAVAEPEVRGAFDSNSSQNLVPEPQEPHLLETADSPNVETDSIIRSIFKIIESPNELMEPEVRRESTTITAPPEAALQSEVQVTPTAVPDMIDTTIVAETELRGEPVFTESPITTTELERRIAPETTVSSILGTEPEVRDEADTDESSNGALESEFATESESIERNSMLDLTESSTMETKAHMESIDTTNTLMEVTEPQAKHAPSSTDVPNTVTPVLLDLREARAVTEHPEVLPATADLIPTSTSSAIDAAKSISLDDRTLLVDESTSVEAPQDSRPSADHSDFNLDTVDLDHLASALDPNERGLLSQIPMLVEKLRRGEVSAEQTKTLRRVFGNLWPLFDEESSRHMDQNTNYNLATLIFRAGQRLQEPSAAIDDSESMDADSREKWNAEAQLASTTLPQPLPESSTPNTRLPDE